MWLPFEPMPSFSSSRARNCPYGCCPSPRAWYHTLERKTCKNGGVFGSSWHRAARYRHSSVLGSGGSAYRAPGREREASEPHAGRPCTSTVAKIAEGNRGLRESAISTPGGGHYAVLKAGKYLGRTARPPSWQMRGVAPSAPPCCCCPKVSRLW